MTQPLHLAIFVIAITLIFDFTNGFNDAANIVATMISSRAISPRIALLIAAVFEFFGAYFLGTAVATTIGKGIIDPTMFRGTAGVWIVISALCGAIGWNVLVWWFGIPSSSSHALIGGLVGSFVIAVGPHAIQWAKVIQIFIILVISPFVGGILGFLFLKTVLYIFRYAPPSANELFKKLQIPSSIFLALSHGTNDAQKSMGVITMSLIILGFLPPDAGVPRWVILACALAIALGMSVGGQRTIKTLGGKLYRIRPVHGFSSQTCSGLVLYSASLFGFPVSTTQVVSGSIMGVGSADRIKAVRWHIVGHIVSTWIITMPSSALLAAGIFECLKFGFHI